MQVWLEKNIHKVVSKNPAMERILADSMSLAVHDVVYDYYEPYSYERRKNEGGLSDTRNMEIASVTIENGKVKLVMENRTLGNDSMANQFISDTIIDGISANWDNPNGRWTDKRDYISHSMNELRNNPQELVEILKAGLISRGLKVK